MAIGTLTQIVIESAHAERTAEFWREILELEPPEVDEDWVTLRWGADVRLSFHTVPGYQPPPWPGRTGEQHVHLDLLVEDFDVACERAAAAGARFLSDVRNPGPRAWRVLADPEGHPFCLVSTPE